MASIREHTKKDGSKTFYVLWRDPDTGKQTSLPFPVEANAIVLQRLLNANGQRLAAAEALLQQASPAAEMTLNQAFERHIKSLTRANEHTTAEYEKMWEHRRIASDLGNLPVAKVTDEEVGAWLKEGLKVYAHKTMANSVGLLSSVFKTAVRRGWAPANPCDLVRLPEKVDTERKATFLTLKEFWLLHDVFAERHRLMLRAFVASGLRFSEMTALEVETTQEALARKTPALPVVRAWKKSKAGGFHLGAPKAESVRDVSIHADLAAEILEHIENFEPGGLVFPNQFGRQLRNTTFHNAGWQDAVKAARKKGLRKTPRPHDLRHTHASWMLSEGMSVYDLSKRLGHKSTNTTEQIYGHLMQKAQTAGATMIGEIMKR
ncbi:tyrosine-type recombinase/integrase [Microbacterium sp.]|uniref:tyrosine-type recombinase/integrase n=1 Tax=Microbacterium sp. TaxID=51671 RepID=UPI0039E2B2B8